MTDDHQNDAEESLGSSSDRPLNKRPSDPEDQGSRSRRDRRSGMEPDGNGIAPRDGRVQPDDALDAEIVDQVSERVTEHMMAVVSHSGPLPPVLEFGGYEKVLPGSADRILSMAELSAKAAAEATWADSAATRAAAESVLEDGRAVKRGQIIFALLAALCIILAVVLVVLGHTVPAGLLGILGFASGVGALIKPVNKDRWRPENSRNGQQE